VSEAFTDDAQSHSDFMSDDEGRSISWRVYAWLNAPLRTSWRLIGWIAATIVFVTLIHLLGGPTEDDVSVSAYSSWAVAHGHLACMYSPPSNHYFPPIASPYSMIAPLYPLISGAILAITHAGSPAAFPAASQLGSHCSHALVAMFNWSATTDVIVPTINVAYLMWLPLMIGAIFLIRASGRGRNRWEPLLLLGLALLTPVLECLVTYFHPQDVLAISLALCSLAFVLRRQWIWSGVMLGLAFTSQSFVLLIAAVLVVVVPGKDRIRFALASVATVVLIVAPLALITSGRAFKWSVIGTGSVAPKGIAGDTLMREIGRDPNLLLGLARTLPVIGALLLALWAKKRLGEAALDAVPLLSIAATALALRLVFEVSLWGYYFAASVVLILINDVIQGRVRGHLMAFLALFTLVYNPVPWGFAPNGQSWGLAVREDMPKVFVLVALLLVLIDIARRHVRWYIVAWLVFVCATLLANPFSNAALRTAFPNWFWQVILVPITVGLAISPLIKSIKSPADQVAGNSAAGRESRV
jgi:hypothetical protein